MIALFQCPSGHSVEVHGQPKLNPDGSEAPTFCKRLVMGERLLDQKDCGKPLTKLEERIK